MQSSSRGPDNVKVSDLNDVIDLPREPINDPLSGKHFSLSFLPATSSSWSCTLEGLFEMTHGATLFQSGKCRGASETNGHCYLCYLCRARRGGPRTPSKPTDTNLCVC